MNEFATLLNTSQHATIKNQNNNEQIDFNFCHQWTSFVLIKGISQQILFNKTILEQILSYIHCYGAKKYAFCTKKSIVICFNRKLTVTKHSSDYNQVRQLLTDIIRQKMQNIGNGCNLHYGLDVSSIVTINIDCAFTAIEDNTINGLQNMLAFCWFEPEQFVHIYINMR